MPRFSIDTYKILPYCLVALFLMSSNYTVEIEGIRHEENVWCVSIPKIFQTYVNQVKFSIHHAIHICLSSLTMRIVVHNYNYVALRSSYKPSVQTCKYPTLTQHHNSMSRIQFSLLYETKKNKQITWYSSGSEINQKSTNFQLWKSASYMGKKSTLIFIHIEPNQCFDESW